MCPALHDEDAPGPTVYMESLIDLVSSQDLNPLAKAIEGEGYHEYSVTLGEDGSFYALLRAPTRDDDAPPHADISTLVDIVEVLPDPLRAIWDACTKRAFSPGFTCGDTANGYTWAGGVPFFL